MKPPSTIEYPRATRTRAIVGLVVVLVIVTLVLDLLVSGPASHAFDPPIPWFFRID